MREALDAHALIRDQRGQSTIEAACMLPLLLVGVLLLVQPGIVLYDRMIMSEAAAEGCRVLATCPAEQTQTCRDFILRRLGPIPPSDLFHVHGEVCSWEIALDGSDSSTCVSVGITNKVRPLPLMGVGAGFLDLVDEQGFLTISVTYSLPTQPSWVSADQWEQGPSGWVGSAL